MFFNFIFYLGGRGSPATIGKPGNRARNANSTASGVDSSFKQTDKKVSTILNFSVYFYSVTLVP